MGKWNRADGALVAAAICFAACFALRLRCGSALWIEALLFCSEAALVGGIADWFAVTALFRKPLGFPWHTALISRRREQLAASCVKLVREEFFSKKKLIAHLRRLELFEMLLRFAEKRQGKALLAGWILQGLEDGARRMDLAAAAEAAQRFLRERLQDLPPERLAQSLGRKLLADGRGEAYFDSLLREARAALAAPAVKEKLRRYLEEYAAERTGGVVSSLLSMIAQRSNLLNFSEAAEILQTHLLAFVDDLADPGSFRRAEALRLLRESAAEVLRDETWRALAADWLRAFFARFPGEDTCRAFLDGSLRALLRDMLVRPPTRQMVVQKPLVGLLLAQVDALVEKLRQDAKLRGDVDAYLYDFAARATLQAQEMVGAAVAEILGGMDDAALSALLYEKVEPDLVWIRLNGTIVGAGIGLVLFILLQLLG